LDSLQNSNRVLCFFDQCKRMLLDVAFGAASSLAGPAAHVHLQILSAACLAVLGLQQHLRQVTIPRCKDTNFNACKPARSSGNTVVDAL
jgi:hypothetical protein